MRKLKSIIILIIALSGIAACTDPACLYYSYQSLPGAEWKQTDTICFEVNIPDSLTDYHMHIALRHASGYPYRNLSLGCAMQRNDSTPLTAPRQMDLTLASPDGEWLSDGWAGIYHAESEYGNIHPQHTGTYRIKVWHCMTDSLLQGICDVGIKIDR